MKKVYDVHILDSFVSCIPVAMLIQQCKIVYPNSRNKEKTDCVISSGLKQTKSTISWGGKQPTVSYSLCMYHTSLTHMTCSMVPCISSPPIHAVCCGNPGPNSDSRHAMHEGMYYSHSICYDTSS